MTIEEFEKEIMEIMRENISAEEKERIRWFTVKIKSGHKEKNVTVTSLVMDGRFDMFTCVTSLRKNYELAFNDVVNQIKEKFA